MDEFKKKFLKQLAKYFDANRYSFQEMEVIKNNDRKLHGICIMEHDSAYGMNIYVEEVYQIYQELSHKYKDIDPWDVILYDLVEQIEYEKTAEDRMVSENIVAQLLHYDSIQDRLIFRLINAKRNKKYLKDKVYMPVMDLALCLHVLANEPEKDNKVGSIVVSKEIADSWGIPIEQLFATAKQNMVRLFPPRIARMVDVLEELLENDRFSYFMNPPIHEEQENYILTNWNGIYGATALCYDSVLKDFSDTQDGKNFYILPCSIHETILIPAVEFRSHIAGKLLEIVKEVNQTCVSSDEILSDSVYYYNRVDDEIMLCGQCKTFEHSEKGGK